MLTTVYGAKCIGIEAVPVAVEIDIASGIGIHLVGLADAAVKESLLRVLTAMESLGHRIPGRKIVINLAPADLRKNGSGYDLPIAAGILASAMESPPPRIGECLLMGELGLDGICATNTTTWRPWQDIEKSGGMSGKPLFEKSLEIVRYISKVTDGKLPIIGVGGIVDLDSAGKMMNAGASLVQVYTGMVFRGPFFARSLAKSLIWRDSNWV